MRSNQMNKVSRKIHRLE